MTTHCLPQHHRTCLVAFRWLSLGVCGIVLKISMHINSVKTNISNKHCAKYTKYLI